MSDFQRIVLYSYINKFDPAKIIRVGLSYNLGGMNYFTGSVETRGYYLDVQPLEHVRGMTMVRGFSGTKMLFREANRFGQKRLEALAKEVIQDTDGECSDRLSLIMEHVLTKNQIDLADYDLKQEYGNEPVTA